MANYATLKAAIAAAIKQNGNNEITGALLQQQLLAMVNSLGSGYQYAGIATPTTNPGTPDQNVFYIAFQSGIYSNFDNLTITGLSVLKYSGAWSVDNIVDVDLAPTKDSNNLITSGAIEKVTSDILGYVGFNITEGKTINDARRYTLISGIKIPAGKTFKITASGTYSWTRAIICYNGITSSAGYLKDYALNGQEYTITAPDDIFSLQLYIVSGNGSGTISLNVVYDGEIVDNISEQMEELSERVNEIENDLDNEQKSLLVNKHYNTINVSQTGWVVLLDNIFIKAGQQFTITLGGSATLGRAILAYNNIKTSPWWVDYVEKNKVYTFIAPTDITEIDLYLVNGSPSGTITIYLSADNILPQHHFDGFRENATISSSASVCKIDNVHIAKNIMCSAHVIGLGSSDIISFGIGYFLTTTSRRETLAMYFKIASNSIELYRASDPAAPTLIQTWQYSVLDYSDIMLTLIVDNTQNANWKFIIEDCRGDETILDGNEWVASGEPFVESLSATVSVALSFMPRDICKRIWVFGDSYTQPITSNMKWPNRLIENGISSFLLNSLSGLNPVDGYNDLQNLLTLKHKPAFVFWCLGMNGPADTDQNTINPTQKTTIDNVLALCIANNITPIFATIPTVPSRQKTALSNYIRSLGVRYVDVADAVGSTPNGEWNPRLISYDNLHPSQYGALVISQRVMLDFPEIAIFE